MSLLIGLSGLNASSRNLEVIGNNIANANTVGAKASRGEFADMYASSLMQAGMPTVGIGVRLATVSQQFTQGNLTVTDNAMDLAVNGRGFFQVGDGASPARFTRNGQFKIVEGTGDYLGKRMIVDNNGLFLMGVPEGETTPGPLTLPSGMVKAKATSAIDIDLNLKSDDPALTTALPASVADLGLTGSARTVNYATSQVVHDAEGQEIPLTYHFRKVAAIDGKDSWAVYATAHGAIVPAADPIAPAFFVSFDADGGTPQFRATAAGAASDSPPPLSIPATVLDGVTYGEVAGVALDLSGMTQYKGSYSVTQLSQDGYAAGTMSDFAFEPDGTLTVNYTNGQSAAAGRVQLAQFANTQGLQPLGNNLWAQSLASGIAVVNGPGEGGNGVLQQGALEESNVDLTAELVNMITAQRVYQANAQTIKTADQVIQTLVNLR